MKQLSFLKNKSELFYKKQLANLDRNHVENTPIDVDTFQDESNIS